jgi:hypothetical protein
METLFIDFANPRMIEKIVALKPTKGYCILLDITGSTRLKDKPEKDWMIELYNTFALMRTFFLFLRPLKCIGDELMFYISETETKRVFGSPLGLFTSVCSITNEWEKWFKSVKASIVYCENAYAISFVKGASDIYGKEIDLAARLIAEAKARQIVMGESFYHVLEPAYARYGSALQVPEFSKVIGPVTKRLKGFRAKQNFYTIQF